ncbi:MAG: hypothetical protein AAF549_04975 [Pseudomonadota bacterium]
MSDDIDNKREWLRDYTNNRSKDKITYISEFKLLVDALGIREEANKLQDAAIGYANLGLKSLIAINGGGLVSLPILEKLGFSVEEIGFSALMFTFGLVSVITAIILAYFSCANASNSVNNDLNNRYCFHMSTAHSLRGEKEFEKHYKDQITEDNSYLISRWCENIATLFSIASLIFFIIGVAGPYLEISNKQSEIVNTQKEDLQIK